MTKPHTANEAAKGDVDVGSPNRQDASQGSGERVVLALPEVHGEVDKEKNGQADCKCCYPKKPNSFDYEFFIHCYPLRVVVIRPILPNLWGIKL